MNTTVTFFKNAFDNAVTDDCAISYTCSELVEELRAGLVISDDKNSLGFVWAKYNTADPAELVPTSATDPTPQRNRSGYPSAVAGVEPRGTSSSPPAPRRLAGTRTPMSQPRPLSTRGHDD